MKHAEVMTLATENLDLDEVMAAAEEQMFGMENDGFCVKCGYQQMGCEPDAKEYICEDCGEAAVFGASQLLIYMG